MAILKLKHLGCGSSILPVFWHRNHQFPQCLLLPFSQFVGRGTKKRAWHKSMPVALQRVRRTNTNTNTKLLRKSNCIPVHRSRAGSRTPRTRIPQDATSTEPLNPRIRTASCVVVVLWARVHKHLVPCIRLTFIKLHDYLGPNAIQTQRCASISAVSMTPIL